MADLAEIIEEPSLLERARTFFTELAEPPFQRGEGVGFFNDFPGDNIFNDSPPPPGETFSGNSISLTNALVLGALAGGAWLFLRSVRKGA